MILFKNRYAEFDNLDDAYNQNVFRNCYHREYFKNFSKFNRPHNRNENLRYSRGQNFNDLRLNNYNNYQRQSAMTPFPQLSMINNNMNYNNNSGNYGYQQQNFLHQRSSPNMPSAFSNNNNYYIRTPISRYNNYDNNEYGFKSNNYDGNISNDDIQFYNEGNNILNLSNDSQYSQEQNQNILRNSNEYIRQSLDNELDALEKERKLLLEQEKLNKIDFELRYLRQKRKSDLERRLAEEQQNLELINRIKENDLQNLIYNNQNYNKRRINNNYRINNFRNNSNPYNNNKVLEESLKTSVMNDKFYMNGLIDEINRMKLSQQEANFEFQKKMKDLEKQNESIQLANQKMIQKIKDMKNALSSDKKENYDDYNNNYDYLIGQRNNRIKEKKLFENNDYDNNSKSLNNYRNFNDFDNRKYYLGKKDNDIEEFNLLNKNLVNNNNVVVTPLLFNENKNKYNINYDLNTQNENYQNKNRYNFDEEYKNNNFKIGNDYNDTRNENLYSLIRKNNDRLERIKEIEEKNKYDINY